MVDDLLRLILAHINEKKGFPIVVSGGVGSGKTEVCRMVIRRLEGAFDPGGIISPRVIESGSTTGYDVLNVETGEKRPFVRSTPPGVRVGRFFLRPGALEFANEAISGAIGRREPVFADEVGRMELKQKGLAPAIKELIGSDTQGIFLVRTQFLPRFRKVFGVYNYDEFRIPQKK